MRKSLRVSSTGKDKIHFPRLQSIIFHWVLCFFLFHLYTKVSYASWYLSVDECWNTKKLLLTSMHCSAYRSKHSTYVESGFFHNAVAQILVADKRFSLRSATPSSRASVFLTAISTSTVKFKGGSFQQRALYTNTWVKNL